MEGSIFVSVKLTPSTTTLPISKWIDLEREANVKG